MRDFELLRATSKPPESNGNKIAADIRPVSPAMKLLSTGLFMAL
jgi:hypothetical protein